MWDRSAYSSWMCMQPIVITFKASCLRIGHLCITWVLKRSHGMVKQRHLLSFISALGSQNYQHPCHCKARCFTVKVYNLYVRRPRPRSRSPLSEITPLGSSSAFMHIFLVVTRSVRSWRAALRGAMQCQHHRCKSKSGAISIDVAPSVTCSLAPAGSGDFCI